jgi:undecaprenyl-diphosphatase
MNPAVLSSHSNLFLTFIASFLIWFLFLGLFYLWIIDGRVKKEVVIHAIFATMISWALVSIIKSLIPTLRPFEVNNSLPLTITIPSSSAFPSLHSAVAFAIAVSVWFHNKRIGITFITGAFLVALGRVLSNVHWLSDVIFGGLMGYLTSILLVRVHFFRFLRK